ncbi:MAG: hypothetical protein JWP25_6069 [Bradyrhizobium sp.]|nr:hypothetical protein [Bradyrhizobium sp.]
MAFDRVDFDKPLTTFVAKNAPVRFAVGNPDGLTSHSWRVWSEKRSELYLSCRDAFKDTKVSLHASGKWRMGYTQEAVRSNPKLVEGDRNRAWELWEKPPPVMPNVVVAFSIYFLASEFILTKELRPAKAWAKVRYVDASAAGFVTVVSLCIADTEMIIEHAEASVELGQFDLSDGKLVYLIAHDTIDTDISQKVLQIRALMSRAAYERGVEAHPDTFGYFLAHRPDGTRNLIGVKMPIQLENN